MQAELALARAFLVETRDMRKILVLSIVAAFALVSVVQADQAAAKTPVKDCCAAKAALAEKPDCGEKCCPAEAGCGKTQQAKKKSAYKVLQSPRGAGWARR